MCGRYRLTAKERYLRDHFGLDVGVKWLPRWNIAPTQMIPTIRQHPKEPTRIFNLMRWGLIPYWAKDPSIGLKTINAMSKVPFSPSLAYGTVGVNLTTLCSKPARS
jgi:putative SOS response-associated peptidase YedK